MLPKFAITVPSQAFKTDKYKFKLHASTHRRNYEEKKIERIIRSHFLSSVHQNFKNVMDNVETGDHDIEEMDYMYYNHIVSKSTSI